MKYAFKGAIVELPEGFILTEEGGWHKLYHVSKREPIAGISPDCSAEEFKERINKHIENYQSFSRELEASLT